MRNQPKEEWGHFIFSRVEINLNLTITTKYFYAQNDRNNFTRQKISGNKIQGHGVDCLEKKIALNVIFAKYHLVYKPFLQVHHFAGSA